jgi:hypothetical protein
MKETRNSETTLKNIKKGHNNRTKKIEIVEVMMKKKKLIKNNDYHKREKISNTKPPDLREENPP